MPKARNNGVVFQPEVRQRFAQGAKTLVDMVRPTLGPQPRMVAVSPVMGNDKPEILDDGATIVRRVVQIADRDEDMGAMFVRHVLWRIKEQTGDGTATGAVLFQSLYEQGVRYLAAGGNAQQLRHFLERGMQTVLDELAAMTVRREGKHALAQIAETTCHDRQLAKLLGEIFDIIGDGGRLEIRAGRGLADEREYVEGLYYENSGVLGRAMLADEIRERTEWENAALMLSDLDITEPRDLVPLLAQAQAHGIQSLVIMVNSLADDGVAFLLRVNREVENFHVLAVKTPGSGFDEQRAALEDLALLTGGRPLLRAAGDSLRTMKIEQLGRARRIWASRKQFGIVGGNGDARALRAHLATLRSAFKHANDAAQRKRLQGRIGKLLGGSATLLIGGLSEHDIDARKHLAERTAEGLRGALREGVVPGGGVALLHCRAALARMAAQAADETERVAYRMLMGALEEPFRVLVANAGYDPSIMLAGMQTAPPDTIFDVRSGEFADAASAGIFDVATVQQAAVRHAVGGAALALTIDVLVHTKRPIVSANP
jgi:chaperonin GroEL